MNNLEETNIILKKHWLGFCLEIIILIILAYIPLFTLWFLTADLQTIISTEVIFKIGFLYIAWLMLLSPLFWIAWTDYRLEYWLITDRYLLTIGQWQNFRRETRTFNLLEIREIEVIIPSISADKLSLGQLIIHFSNGESLKSPWIISPALAKQEILEIKNSIN